MAITLYYLFKILSIILLILAFAIKAIISIFTNFETALIEKLKKFHLDYDLVMWVVFVLFIFLSWSSFKVSAYYDGEAEKVPAAYIETIAVEDVSLDKTTNTLICTLPEEVAKEANTNQAIIGWRRQVKPLDEEHPSPCYEVYESKWGEDLYVYIVYTEKSDEINYFQKHPLEN